jgi:hypothetical protein
MVRHTDDAGAALDRQQAGSYEGVGAVQVQRMKCTLPVSSLPI